MKMPHILLLLATSTFASAEGWKVETKVDTMTDVTRTYAMVTAKTGETLTVLQRDDMTIWAYFELSGANQFSVNDRLTLRVDKNKPIEYNQDFQDVSRELGLAFTVWEWNPSLIGFEVGSTKAGGGCHKVIPEIYAGETLVIRYHPNQSTSRDVSFTLANSKEVISKAIEIKC